ncbi:RNA polymerase II subunit A C-terminal domain phosphatase ssup-72 [Parelaphostrongylus tenuis]|uniref:RNA polymerase II subunit A C-terminal domain phosphatase SSU72 n=1 Tax=Parelaphostrongylus tenuis TaxID=148309 RepID=A0AAD5WGX1_PARTN|nr:RNA polymerase II subunit A C-terminal domain phosphatase ssup-72 [Parelaphostrongylus tenuis]
MNRSMEAHSFMQKRGFIIESYGSGNQVKLPGTAIDKPNCYEFGKATYEYIYNDLKAKDAAYYTQNGLLNMLDRNRRIKPAPQKFQHEDQEFDVIICLEERVYDQVVDHLHTKPSTSGNPAHVINIDIEDNPEEATIGAWFVCELCGKKGYTIQIEQLNFLYHVSGEPPSGLHRKWSFLEN